ncbi:hypothetical protein N9Y92_02525 [Chlamydiales bacterium]|nr:hypothetical protein [Chlamydiales bacterium]
MEILKNYFFRPIERKTKEYGDLLAKKVISTAGAIIGVTGAVICAKHLFWNRETVTKFTISAGNSYINFLWNYDGNFAEANIKESYSNCDSLFKDFLGEGASHTLIDQVCSSSDPHLEGVCSPGKPLYTLIEKAISSGLIHEVCNFHTLDHCEPEGVMCQTFINIPLCHQGITSKEVIISTMALFILSGMIYKKVTR